MKAKEFEENRQDGDMLAWIVLIQVQLDFGNLCKCTKTGTCKYLSSYAGSVLGAGMNTIFAVDAVVRPIAV